MWGIPKLVLALVLAITGYGTAAASDRSANGERAVLAGQSDQARRVDCTRVRCVALTFDDGPGKHTGRLLDILAERGARATFFVLGRLAAEDEFGLLRRMVAEGHELGNHSWDHSDLTRLSPQAIRDQLDQTQQIVRWRTGVDMRLMRPPYGATDDRVAEEARRQGLAQILWDADTFDWRHRDSSLVVRHAEEAEPGSVVLMHDIHESTVEAVPGVLDRLSEQGYEFVTVSELFGDHPLHPGASYRDARRSSPGRHAP